MSLKGPLVRGSCGATRDVTLRLPAAAASLLSCLTLCDPWAAEEPWDSSFMGVFHQEYWSGLPGPPPGDLPNPGIKPRSRALQVDSLPSEPTGMPTNLFGTMKTQWILFGGQETFLKEDLLMVNRKIFISRDGQQDGNEAMGEACEALWACAKPRCSSIINNGPLWSV